MIAPTNLEQSLGDKELAGQLPSEFDLGVLIVHGIGEQQRGDTLTESADAVVDWLRRRIEERGDGSVVLVDVALRQPSSDDVAPAHLALAIRVRGEGGRYVNAKWLIAESWWADAFRQSSFTDLALWGITVAPWVVATHVTSLRERMARPAGVTGVREWVLAPIAILVWAVWMFVASLVALLTAALAVFLIIFRLIPLPFVPEIASAIQRVMAGGVGDAFVLVRSPVRFGAMASQVRADLGSLSRRCTSIAVIAHSQGTAVAWEAIRSSSGAGRGRLPWNLRLFITYGQALRKLQFLRQAGRRSLDRERLLGMAMIGVVILSALGVVGLLPSAIGPFMRWLAIEDSPLPASVVALIALLVVTLLAQFYLYTKSKTEDAAAKETLERQLTIATAGRDDFVWHDLWASADPMPNGPINLDNPVVQSTKVRNSASAVLDHVSYWQNFTEFLPLVAGRLKSIGALGTAIAPEAIEDPRITLAAMRRQARVLLLAASRLSLLIVGAALLLSRWEQLGQFGDSVLAWLRTLPLIELIDADEVVWLGQAVGVAIGIVAALAVWQLILAAWRLAIAADDRAYLRPRAAQPAANAPLGEPLWTWPWRLLLVAVVGLVFIGLGVTSTASVQLAIVAATWVLGTVPLALTLISAGGRRWGQPAGATAPLVVKGNRRLTAWSWGVAALLLVIPLVVMVVARPALPLVVGIELWAIAIVLILEAVVQYRAFRAVFEGVRRQEPAVGVAPARGAAEARGAAP